MTNTCKKILGGFLLTIPKDSIDHLQNKLLHVIVTPAIHNYFMTLVLFVLKRLKCMLSKQHYLTGLFNSLLPSAFYHTSPPWPHLRFQCPLVMFGSHLACKCFTSLIVLPQPPHTECANLFAFFVLIKNSENNTLHRFLEDYNRAIDISDTYRIDRDISNPFLKT